MMGFFEVLCWGVTLLGAVLGAILFVTGFLDATGAPQQAAAAAGGVACAVIPYVFTRSIQATGRDTRERAAAKAKAKVTATQL